MFAFASARALALLDDGLIAAIAMMPNREVESVWWRVFEQLVAEHRRCLYKAVASSVHIVGSWVSDGSVRHRFTRL